MTNNPIFAQELLDKILDEVHANRDIESLKSCALSSKLLFSKSQSLLFYRVCIGRPEYAQRHPIQPQQFSYRCKVLPKHMRQDYDKEGAQWCKTLFKLLSSKKYKHLALYVKRLEIMEQCVEMAQATSVAWRSGGWFEREPTLPRLLNLLGNVREFRLVSGNYSLNNLGPDGKLADALVAFIQRPSMTRVEWDTKREIPSTFLWNALKGKLKSLHMSSCDRRSQPFMDCLTDFANRGGSTVEIELESLEISSVHRGRKDINHICETLLAKDCPINLSKLKSLSLETEYSSSDSSNSEHQHAPVAIMLEHVGSTLEELAWSPSEEVMTCSDLDAGSQTNLDPDPVSLSPCSSLRKLRLHLMCDSSGRSASYPWFIKLLSSLNPFAKLERLILVLFAADEYKNAEDNAYSDSELQSLSVIDDILGDMDGLSTVKIVAQYYFDEERDRGSWEEDMPKLKGRGILEIVEDPEGCHEAHLFHYEALTRQDTVWV